MVKGNKIVREKKRRGRIGVRIKQKGFVEHKKLETKTCRWYRFDNTCNRFSNKPLLWHVNNLTVCTTKIQERSLSTIETNKNG